SNPAPATILRNQHFVLVFFCLKFGELVFTLAHEPI
ncbi:MAG: hypothetical protein ACI97K_000425, partial [Glaciecola sp.]